MKKIITFEIPQLKTDVVKSIIDELKNEVIEKQHLIKTNEIITKNLNKVIDSIYTFMAENIPELVDKLQVCKIRNEQGGHVLLISKTLRSNYCSNKAMFGFKITPISYYNHNHSMYILTGEIKITMVTRYTNGDINLADIGDIFTNGKGTLKEIIKADYSELLV